MKRYEHKAIEKKWQQAWKKKGIYRSKEKARAKKAYVLDMFPYPSGEGLHVGHPKGYIATDVYARMKRMQGYSVLHPMGWDAFGLPAENFALKHKVHPRKAVEKNIKRFKEQLGMIGLDYDWTREINTTDPGFYKWTQWIFLQLLKKGLAYQSYEPINWCPSCQTGLANEDLEDGRCERCGSAIEHKPMRQWVLKITDYAERLLADLDLLGEWQEHIKESQRNWIGKSEGAEIDFPLEAQGSGIRRFVLLHGKGGSPETNFLPWMRKELERLGYEVQVPALPDPGAPDDEEQAEYVRTHCRIDEHTAVVGHSFGGIVALRLLESDVRMGKLVLVGTPYSDNFIDNKKRPTVSIAVRKGFAVQPILRNAKRIVLLYDTHDHVVPISDGEAFAQLFGRPLFRRAGRATHFCAEREPDVLRAALPAVTVFTTRPDTLFGATYLVLAPEHPLVGELLAECVNASEARAYIAQAGARSEIERTAEGKEKTGVRLEGVCARNPATNEEIPVYIADYVLAHYGTGAIMAVPAHDERDFAFAQKFGLPIRQVVAPVTTPKYEGGDAVRPGQPFKERDAVMCIVKHWEKDEYLCLQWNDHPEVCSFISGGIESDEDVIAAGKREILEESGYKNAGFVRQIGGFSYIEFYHQIKQTNVRARFRYLYYELEDGEQNPVDAAETRKHSTFWKPKNEVYDFLALVEKDTVWKGFLEGSKEIAYIGSGYLVNSENYDGLATEGAKRAIAEAFGEAKSTYRLRDWVFSRQRYWGEPIPVIHCEKCGVVPVPEKDLPVKLPDVKRYEPSGTGESPLATIEKWVKVKCPVCKGLARRETNTMPQWAGSSWYHLRYMDPKNAKTLVDKKKEKYWAPVDLYVGGAEHATRHLIYARFWHKFLYDIKAVSTKEPFTRLISVGLIQAEDGRKMSKRFGNVINPDDVIKRYGADTLRLYEMFMGPFTDAIAWNTNSMIGTRRFVEKVWRMQERVVAKDNPALEGVLHKTIKKVGEDIEAFKFNTAISQMMIFVNEVGDQSLGLKQWRAFLQTLAPFAPHITEELWSAGKGKGSIHLQKWPSYDPKKLIADEITIVVQINGKVRAHIRIAAETAQADVEQAAREATATRIAGKEIIKTVFVPGRLVNFVVRE